MRTRFFYLATTALALGLLGSGPGLAQTAHEEHHTPEATAAPAPGTGPGTMGSMMQGDMPMMRGMMQQTEATHGGGMRMHQPAPGITIIINTHELPGQDPGGPGPMGMMGQGMMMGPGMMGQGMMGQPATGSGAASPSTMAYAHATAQMHRAMNVQFTGDPDGDFARAMIPHHQGAIDMARIALEHGKDPEIRALATAVIEAQEKEIATLREWLAKNPQR